MPFIKEEIEDVKLCENRVLNDKELNPMPFIKEEIEDVKLCENKDEDSGTYEEKDAIGSTEEDSSTQIVKEDRLLQLNRKTVNRSQAIQEARQQLPIFYEQEEITSLIRNNTVVIIKGATGSGKTTQIPQFLYECGLSEKGLICITQPRRISTTSICSRINEEFGEDLCGYKIRYDNNLKINHHLVAMTDGILIKEVQEDFLLTKYSVIIHDEIHERSCNLDILISLLAKIVKMRYEMGKELKLVLMSASETSFEINNFFSNVKSFHVPSSQHKLSIFYEDKSPTDYILSAYNTIKKIIKKETEHTKAVLVFLPSKTDIYRLKNMIEEQMSVIALPLHSSLSKIEQVLVFKTYDRPKIILSTNIAETSITIPDIAYVVDSGLVKNKYVSQGIVQYTTEYISKSSALQRAGRAGRTCKGVVYRLYSGETFSIFPDQDTPKIQYEPLDSIVLDLIALGIPDVYKFPFVSPPPTENIEVSLLNLKRLGVIDKDNKLTKVGNIISKLPVHPKLSRLLCIPDTSHLLPRLILVVSCLSVNFELKKTKDTEKYFTSEKSDLIVIIKILIEFLNNKKKKETSFNMTEASKMNRFLLKKFYKDDKIGEAMKIQQSSLDNEEKTQLRRLFFRVYGDNLAIPNTDSYFFKQLNVYPSSSSIDPNDEFVVFDYLSQGNKKIYMRNITIIDKEWLT